MRPSAMSKAGSKALVEVSPGAREGVVSRAHLCAGILVLGGILFGSQAAAAGPNPPVSDKHPKIAFELRRHLAEGAVGPDSLALSPDPRRHRNSRRPCPRGGPWADRG